MASRLRGKETLISQMMMHVMTHGNTPCERTFAAKLGKRPLMRVHRRPQTSESDESIKKLGVMPPGALPPAADPDTSVGTPSRVPD
jgi:hypothetical protein